MLTAMTLRMPDICAQAADVGAAGMLLQVLEDAAARKKGGWVLLLGLLESGHCEEPCVHLGEVSLEGIALLGTIMAA